MEWNREQIRFLNYNQGRLRIFGGPGSGKTEIALNKAAALLRNTGGKAKIAVITRNQLEADDLQRKLYSILGNNPVKVATSHLLAVKCARTSRPLISPFSQHLLLIDILRGLSAQNPFFLRIQHNHRLLNEVLDLLALFRWNLIEPEDLPLIPGDSLLRDLKLLYERLLKRIEQAGFISETELYESAAANSDKLNLAAVIIEQAQEITPFQYPFLKSIIENTPFAALFGDPYRNIYRFEGADPDIMRSRLQTDFPDLITVHLNHSYRLGEEQIAFIRNMFRSEDEPFLPASSSGNCAVSFAQFDNPFEESSVAAAEIEDLIRRENFEPEDIAIVLRSPSVQGFRYRRQLISKDIPVNGGRTVSLNPMIIKLLNDIRNLESAESVPHKIPALLFNAAKSCADDETALKGLARTGKIMQEAYTILPAYSPADIVEWVKDEFLKKPIDQEIGGVSITSIHQARCKPFKVVFIPCLVEKSFPSEVEQRFIFGAYWLENLRHKLSKPLSYVERSDLDKHLNEERRLFYTAICLPSDRLYLSRPLMRHGEGLNPSLFLYETGIVNRESESSLPSWGESTSLSLPIESQVQAKAARMLRGLPPEEKSVRLREIEQHLGVKIDISVIEAAAEIIPTAFPSGKIDHLSAGAVNAYLQCPRKFYYQYVLRLELPVTPAMLAGKLMHQVLEKLHSGLGELNAEEAKERLESILRNAIEQEAGLKENPSDVNIIFNHLLYKISAYLDKPEAYSCSVLELEKWFEWQPKPGIVFKGRIDRIDQVDDGVELIDYKSSGKQKHQALSRRFLNIEHDNPDVQLPVYFAAAEEALGMEVERLSLLPLEFKTEGPLRITFEITPDAAKTKEVSKGDLNAVRSDIIALAEKILSEKEFLRGPYTQCRQKYADITCPYIHICDLAE